MTPACQLLKKLHIDFSLHPYDHDPQCHNFGEEAAEKLAVSTSEIFKTLLVSDGHQHFVAVLPVAYQLNLKKAAQALGCKKLTLTEPQQAERLSGYLVGGISPLAQKKPLKTVIDSSAQHFAKIYISGGKRGLDIAIAPQDLVEVLTASFADLIQAE